MTIKKNKYKNNKYFSLFFYFLSIFCSVGLSIIVVSVILFLIILCTFNAFLLIGHISIINPKVLCHIFTHYPIISTTFYTASKTSQPYYYTPTPQTPSWKATQYKSTQTNPIFSYAWVLTSTPCRSA